jgi:GMP synthase-like glutamine amidotransferase
VRFPWDVLPQALAGGMIAGLVAGAALAATIGLRWYSDHSRTYETTPPEPSPAADPMKPVRIVRHVLCTSPGYLAEVLTRHGMEWDLVCLGAGAPVPRGLDGVAGLVLMGGNMSVHDPLAWIAEEMDLVRRAHGAGVPMLGICFGAQILSLALVGTVQANPRGMEVGWHPLTRALRCRCNGWLDGLPERFHGFHWHRESFTAPPGSTLLLEGHCPSTQAFALGDHLGLQFHLEMTEEMVHGWIRDYGRRLEPTARCTQGPEELIRDLPARLGELHRVADALVGAWLSRVRRRTS